MAVEEELVEEAVDMVEDTMDVVLAILSVEVQITAG